MPSSSGDKLCPICDSPLQPGSRKCGFCGTDLSIFDIEVEAPKKVPEPVAQQRPSVESRVDEILSRPAASRAPEPTPPPKVEPPKPAPVTVAPPPEVKKVVEPPKPEPVPEPKVKPAPQVKEEETVAEVSYFECPQCGTSVEVTASSCPKCGVMFAEEGTEMFQCPACNTLVNIDAKSCPGCGALFVEPEAEEAPAAPAYLESKVKKDLEPPLAEVKPLPRKPAKPGKEEKPEEKKPEDKKGFMSLFRRGKKEPEPAPKPEAKPEIKLEVKPEIKEEKPMMKQKPAPTPSPPRPVSRPAEVTTHEVRREEAPAPAPEISAGKDKGRDLARMVAEMKPLLALAREKEVDIGESKQLIDEAALAGRERQIERAIELVQKSKTVLMGRIDASLSDLITRLNDEIKIAREFGGDVSRPTTYIQEVARARAAGDIEAAFVYTEKVAKELLPITGRYNESKRKIARLKQFIADCEVFIVDTREARKQLTDASRALDAKDFDKVDVSIRAADDILSKAIPNRMNEEMRKAKDALLEAKVRNVNITPMLTILKSATSLMKSGDYAQAMAEMREFKEQMKKPA